MLLQSMCQPCLVFMMSKLTDRTVPVVQICRVYLEVHHGLLPMPGTCYIAVLGT